MYSTAQKMISLRHNIGSQFQTTIMGQLAYAKKNASRSILTIFLPAFFSAIIRYLIYILVVQLEQSHTLVAKSS